MTRNKQILLAAVLSASCTAAQATNGYFAHGYSASQRAMGGAGTAMVEDALIASINPAGVVWAKERMDINFSFFAPVRHYRAYERGPEAGNGIFTINPGRYESDNEMFYIPGFAIARAINEQSSWGLAVIGNGGLNTEYRGASSEFATGLTGFTATCEGTFGGGAAQGPDVFGFCGGTDKTSGVNLIQLFVVPSYSLKLGERTSVGIAPIIAGQQFSADGLGAFARFSNAPDKVSDNGNEQSYGAGGRIGFLTGLPHVALGASYQSRIYMSELDKYAGLFAEQGDFDIPSSWNVGLTFRPTDTQRLAIDWQRINFNEVRSVGNRLNPNDFVNNCAIPRLLGNMSESAACLGADGGSGFGWQNVDVLKIGYQLVFGDFKFRAGYSTAKEQPIPSSEVLFNILAPAVPEQHYTAGLSYQMSTAISLDLAVMYAKSNRVRGKNPLSNAEADLLGILLSGLGTEATADAFGSDPQDQDIDLDMHQFEATIGFGYRF